MASGFLALASRVALEPVAFRQLCAWRRRNVDTKQPALADKRANCYSIHNAVQSRPRFNPVGIKMIPEKLHKQVFGPQENPCELFDEHVKNCLEHLRQHDLLPALKPLSTSFDEHAAINQFNLENNNEETIPRSQVVQSKNSDDDIYDVDVDIPQLEGANIDQHFHNIGNDYSFRYKKLVEVLLENSRILQQMPRDWSDNSGWTRYEPKKDGTFLVDSVDRPLEKTFVFDVETCINEKPSNSPTLAVAVSDRAWYSWCSPKLSKIIQSGIEQNKQSNDMANDDPRLNLDLLIPLGSSQHECLVIGHNVGFDRSFIKDQYSFQQDKTRFFDTLSLHMCICGFTGLQRAVKMASKRKLKSNEPLDGIDMDKIRQGWLEQGSLNNLADVFKFHCRQEMCKDERDIFVKGTIHDVAREYQDMVNYCARDVKATFLVFETIYKQFNERFPHPITTAGMLEMSNMYLPVNIENWDRYIGEAQSTFDEAEQNLKKSLIELANQCCSMKEEEYSRDVWLWDLDWSVKTIIPSKTKMEKWNKDLTKARASPDYHETLEDKVQQLYDTKQFMRAKMPYLAGFPKWYRDLCLSPDSSQVLNGEKTWSAGPFLLSTQMRLTPKLMRLTWDGYPLHYHSKHGWGYLVPDDQFNPTYAFVPEGHPYEKFPYEQFLEMCKKLPRKHVIYEREQDDNDYVDDQIDEIRDSTQEVTKNLSNLLSKLSKAKTVAPKYRNEYCPDVEIPGALFFRLPHKNGPSNNVGNPLSKDFSKKVEDGSLTAIDDKITSAVLDCANALSYWKNNQTRIKGQMVVPVSGRDSYGAILPRVIVAGTVTRRAVEPTWLTASNQDQERIGSELKAMVQTPEGYSFVGADVDSQELWIASLYGDSYSYKIHGGTGLSFMTLRGTKTNKTDMHSKTASLIGISRKEAKILNYARIYGAGIKFVQRFLLQNDHRLSITEANEKARKIFKETKGTSVLMDKIKRRQWIGGTESATFNKLEEIASSKEPRTPILNCRISRALEPSSDEDKDFGTSRMNWVVQSSAVDFLHLILINMKWLFKKLDIEGRFSISIHDEVRYIVKHEDRYKAAYALQLTNLLVRAYFAYKLDMRDLPISVAFFTSVDIDTCLRKEVDLDCQSPSNKLGLLKGYAIPFGESLDIKQIISRMKDQNKLLNE